MQVRKETSDEQATESKSKSSRLASAIAPSAGYFFPGEELVLLMQAS